MTAMLVDSRPTPVSTSEFSKAVQFQFARFLTALIEATHFPGRETGLLEAQQSLAELENLWTNARSAGWTEADLRTYFPLAHPATHDLIVELLTLVLYTPPVQQADWCPVLNGLELLFTNLGTGHSDRQDCKLNSGPS